ncbi:MAG TPA: DUF4433 domain-containing protein [Bacteroidetes bacterium]|nr:DUF4433 domain-containing protein [Bacteroidota bacterium]
MNLQETLKYYDITSIWHFTDASNLVSIEKYGLLSLDLLTQQKVHVSCYGGDELSHRLDRGKGLDKFVHLSIIPDHPMQYIKVRNGIIKNPIWLEIDTSVLFENKSYCCNQLANSSYAKCYEIEYLDKIIDLKRLLNNPQPRDPIKKAQLIVANKIDYSKIKGVHHG